ncbi:class I adenylate-forming enzyme family protein [Streptomyces sp. HUAS MG47]|uniref:class I adenylate-forming enzyme family protein n=1 Tax=Streptomyces solicamelliae TaxID=3231716 RepID=UPI003877D0BC
MSTLFHDLIPAELRAQWGAEGRYPGKTLFELFEERVEENPEAPAVIDGEGTMSYGELYRVSLGLARALAEAGTGPGDVVAVNLANGRSACVVDLAVAAVGAVCLPYPVGRRRQDTLAMLSRSRASVAIVTRQIGGTDYGLMLDELRAELPDLREVFVHGEPPAGMHALAPLLADPPEALETPFRADPDSAARILVSSGSEAEPKMIAYSHNALAGGRGEFVRSLVRGEEPPRVMFLVPLASAFGSGGTSVTLAVLGGTLVVLPRFDAAEAVTAIERHRPTHIMGVPTMFQEMLADPRLAPGAADRIDTSSLTALVCGGAGVDPQTVADCVRAFGCALVNLYGSADGVNCHTQVEDDLTTVQTTAGRPNPAVTVIRITGDDGQEVAPGEVGEIWSRGPMSPLCYVNAPELDRLYRTEGGWVRTGDLGRIDAAGRLNITGRKKEIIIRAGLNISPAEVEQMVNTHPAVKSAVCLGVPDHALGERVCVWVVPNAGEEVPDLEGMRSFLYEKQGLERAKLPELFHVVDELPISPAGKVDKHALRASVTTLTTS